MFKIQVNSITRSYGFLTIFKGFSCKIDAGITGISGPNGSGKSTLMKCFANLLRPDSGSVEWILDEKKLHLKDIYKHIGFSAPYIQCYPGLSCFENLELIQKLSTGSTNANQIDDILQKVGLIEKRDTYFGKMSSGQQQRLRLSTALIKNPALLLLDEPGSNLDKAGYEFVKEIVFSAKEEGKTIVIASNDEQELALCDTIINISNFNPSKQKVTS